jgi:expansin (peptidoglycan-binding protein)
VAALAGCGDDGGGADGDGGAGAAGSPLASAGSGDSGPGQGPSGSGAGAPCDGEPTHEGEATYYDADGTGNCSFAADSGFVAALNDPDYDGAAWCGACAAVDGPNGSIVVHIVDRCPECASGDLDLSRNAFEALAPLEQGRVPISWKWAACDVEGPITYHFKEGSNPYWSAIQVRNHRYAIASVEAVDPATGDYVQLVRQDYNFFLWESGLGEGPYTLRTTDVYGNVLEDSGIAFVEAGDSVGAAQLPICE